jgi:hypothetical protein
MMKAGCSPRWPEITLLKKPCPLLVIPTKK